MSKYIWIIGEVRVTVGKDVFGEKPAHCHLLQQVTDVDRAALWYNLKLSRANEI
jgi:hypothetical protein